MNKIKKLMIDHTFGIISMVKLYRECSNLRRTRVKSQTSFICKISEIHIDLIFSRCF